MYAQPAMTANLVIIVTGAMQQLSKELCMHCALICFHTMFIVLAVSNMASLTFVSSATFFMSAARRAAFCSGVLGPLALEKCRCMSSPTRWIILMSNE